MTSARFFVDCNLEPGKTCTLPQNVAHHLIRVLRFQSGEHITLFNGTGGEYQCTILTSAKNTVDVSVDTFTSVSRTSQLSIHLAMCIIKRDGMDNLLARVTELGVTSVTPVVSNRCTVNRKSIVQREPHWERILVSAAEQCGLNQLPILHKTIDLAGWLDAIQTHSGQRRVIGLPDTDNLLRTVDARQPAEEVLLLIGPEGGFDANEVDLALRHNFQPVTLGERTLRAETAPLVMMSALYQYFEAF